MTRIPFILLSTTDGSPLTGATPSVTISKDGAAFASATNTPAEIGNGYYYVDLTATETTVNNNVIVRATATGAQPTAVVWEPEQDLSGLSTFDPSTDSVTINATQAATLAAASDLDSVASKVELIKSKTDNLPESPAAVGSAMTLTVATVTSIKSGLATGANIEAALGALEMYGDTNWYTADLSDVSTFDPSTDAVTLTDAYDAAKTASQLTTSDLSALATSAELTAASASLTTLINLVLSGLYHWTVNDTIMTVYNASDVAIGAYTLTKDTTGNITAVTPIVQQQDTNNEG